MRLAEYDTRTDKDTKHEDVKVTRVSSHKEYDGLINDIMILYLERDVTFTGESKVKKKFVSNLLIQMSIHFFC